MVGQEVRREGVPVNAQAEVQRLLQEAAGLPEDDHASMRQTLDLALYHASLEPSGEGGARKISVSRDGVEVCWTFSLEANETRPRFYPEGVPFLGDLPAILMWTGESGLAVIWMVPGFQDRIRLLFGYEPSSKHLLGMTVLESKETPGLGDKITKDTAFISQFARVEGPVVGVKAGREEGKPNEIIMITGATISSRAVIRAIDATLERVAPLLAAYAGAHGQ